MKLLLALVLLLSSCQDQVKEAQHAIDNCTAPIASEDANGGISAMTCER